VRWATINDVFGGQATCFLKPRSELVALANEWTW
jgi:hypothetical protein